jgi:hypothetical protein
MLSLITWQYYHDNRIFLSWLQQFSVFEKISRNFLENFRENLKFRENFRESFRENEKSIKFRKNCPIFAFSRTLTNTFVSTLIAASVAVPASPESSILSLIISFFPGHLSQRIRRSALPGLSKTYQFDKSLSMLQNTVLYEERQKLSCSRLQSVFSETIRG